MKRALAAFLLIIAAMLAPAAADEGVPMAVVRGPAKLPGVYAADIHPGVTIQKRDVLSVQRQGQIMGEVMAMGMSGDTVYVIPLASYHGTLNEGDVLQFVRHDSAPAAAAPTPPPAPSQQASTQLPVSINASHMEGLPQDVPLQSTSWIIAQGQVTVTNTSSQPMENVTVTVLANGSVVNTQNFPSLAAGQAQTFQWTEYQGTGGSFLTDPSEMTPTITIQVMGYQNGNPGWANAPSMQKATPYNPQPYIYYY